MRKFEDTDKVFGKFLEIFLIKYWKSFELIYKKVVEEIKENQEKKMRKGRCSWKKLGTILSKY